MSIYTKRGDKGNTDICGGRHVKKSSTVISVLGELDELNAFLGLTRLGLKKSDNIKISKIQNDLFIIGSIVAGAVMDKKKSDYLIGRVIWMEQEIDALSKNIKPLKHFILPDGSESSISLHLARAICRRCERSLVLAEKLTVVLPYINRLSDYLFTLALYENRRRGIKDMPVNSDPQL